VNLRADVMGDQSDDAFPVGDGQALTGIRQAARKPVDPQPTVGVKHHFNDVGIVKKRAIAGPNAVRSMRAPREIASD
jgi:hypothetical protein